MSSIRMPVFLALVMLSMTVIVPSVLAAPVSGANLTITGQSHLLGSVNVKDLPLQSHPNTAPSVTRDHSRDAAKLAEGKNIVQALGYVPPGEASKTVVNTPTSPQPLTTTVGLTLEGAPGAAPNPCGCTPPDVNNGVGPNHVFEMVNLAGIIYSKTGTLVKPTFGLDTFFNLPASGLSDPEIMYDSSSGRWFASIVNIPAHSVVFAVSTTNDPTGTFLLYSVSNPNALTDQPFIATNDDKFVISVNDFNTRGSRYLGVQYWVLNKSQLVAGAATIDFVTTAPDSTMFSLHPARHLSASTTFYMVTNCAGSCVSSSTSTTSSATIIAITGVPPGTVSTMTSSFSIATSVIPPKANQPGGVSLNTNDNRILSAVWESGTLSFSSNDACIPSGDTVTRSCSRIVQATTGGTPVNTQDFDYALSGGYTFYPAISTSQGMLALSYGASSATLFPSYYVTGRASADPINTLQAPVTVRAGTASDTSTRYGDYFGAATDPTPTSTSTFWLSGEYDSSSATSWVTAIAQVGAFGPTGTTFDFSVSVNPASDSVVQGNSKTATVTVSLVSGTTQSVSLTASISPSATGLTATLNPTSGTPTYTSTLTVSTTTSTPTGSYTVTITGTSGSLSHSTTYSLTVTAPATGDFSISASPSSLTMSRSGSTSTTVTITSLNSFTGTVSLSTTTPTGVSASFNPASVTVASGGTGTSTLTFSGGAGSTPTGTFTITITGVSGGLTHSTTITLHITKH